MAFGDWHSFSRAHSSLLVNGVTIRADPPESLSAVTRWLGVTATDFLGRPVSEPPANVVIPACRLCSYLGPTFWAETPTALVFEPLREHVEERHSGASLAESMPKLTGTRTG